MRNGTSDAHDAPSNKAPTEPPMRVRAWLMPLPTAFLSLLYDMLVHSGGQACASAACKELANPPGMIVSVDSRSPRL